MAVGAANNLHCYFHPGGLCLLHWTGGESLLCGKNRAGRWASPAWSAIRKMDAKGSSVVPLLALVGSRAPIWVAPCNLFHDPLAFCENTHMNNHMHTCRHVHTHAPTHLDRDNKTARECQPSSCEQTLNPAASAGSVWIVLSTISANLSLTQGGAARDKNTFHSEGWEVVFLLLLNHKTCW